MNDDRFPYGIPRVLLTGRRFPASLALPYVPLIERAVANGELTVWYELIDDDFPSSAEGNDMTTWHVEEDGAYDTVSELITEKVADGKDLGLSMDRDILECPKCGHDEFVQHSRVVESFTFSDEAQSWDDFGEIEWSGTKEEQFAIVCAHCGTVCHGDATIVPAGGEES